MGRGRRVEKRPATVRACPMTRMAAAIACAAHPIST
jgi:hypothetical protein